MKIAENTRVWVISDTHFSHAKILEYEPDRPGTDIVEHNAILTSAWNDTVAPDDLIIHIGDFSFAKIADTKAIFDSLNGRKMLVPGNHDDKDVQRKLEWEKVFQYLTEIKYGDTTVVLCHYPLMVWNKSHYGSIHLHGHSHGGILQRGRRFDVGVDAVPIWKPGHRFGAPVLLADIIDEATNKTNPVVDHHGANGELR